MLFENSYFSCTHLEPSESSEQIRTRTETGIAELLSVASKSASELRKGAIDFSDHKRKMLCN